MVKSGPDAMEEYDYANLPRMHHRLQTLKHAAALLPPSVRAPSTATKLPAHQLARITIGKLSK